MNPEVFFSMTDNPNYEIGHGKRGLRSENDLNDWNENVVKIECLNKPACGDKYDINKSEWLENIPLACPTCNEEKLAHEFIVLGAFTRERVKTYNPDGMTYTEKEDTIVEPFRQACIVRYVKIRSMV